MRARLALLLSGLAAASVARAQPPRRASDSGFVLGARVGWGIPFGDIAGDTPVVRNVVERKIPVWLELGYRFNRRFTGALYLELAPATVASDRCDPGASCTASDVRFGLAVRAHLAPSRTVDPWVGIGLGVEILNAKTSESAPIPGQVEWSWAGVELPIEGGVDVAVFERFSLGPYVSFTLARFTSVSRRPEGGTTTSGAIDDRSNHQWLQAGVKGTLRF